MFSERWRVAALLLFGLAACGPLPRPFAPDVKPGWSGPLKLVDGPGVVVDADDCAAPGIGPVLGEAVSLALHRRDVPATTGRGNRGSLRLRCSLSSRDGVTIARWSLRDASGAPVGAFATSAIGADATSSDALAAWADEAAFELVGFLRPAPRPAVSAGLPRLVVLTVVGAPGDGDASLTRAMTRALRTAGAELALVSGDDTLLVLGSVTVRDAVGGEQTVEILWEVLDPDGRRLGVVTQQNNVPRGTFDGAWGTLATVIAAGGAEGVLALVEGRSAP